jgi:CheY-like chemotaxis protein
MPSPSFTPMTYYRNAFLLDDDPIANFLLETTLRDERMAHHISAFTSFPALLDAFTGLAEGDTNADELPDLLLLDMHMPGKDAFDVLDRVLSIPGLEGNKVCVFLMSASYDPRLEEKIKEYPVSGYLTKPLDATAVHQLIRSAVKDECDL